MRTSSIPDEPTRRTALHFLAAAIENADEERSDSWYLRERRQTPISVVLWAKGTVPPIARRDMLRPAAMVSYLGSARMATHAGPLSVCCVTVFFMPPATATYGTPPIS